MTEWFGDFQARRRRLRSRRLAFDDVVDAVRVRSAGKTRAEVEDIVAAELRGRGRPVPSATALGFLADRVLAGQDPVSQIRLQARGARLAANSVSTAVQQVRDFHRLTRPVDLEDEPLFIRFDRSRPAEVTLDPGAQRLLSPPPGISAPAHLEVFVIIRQDGEDGQVAIHFDEGRLGVLSPADGPGFHAHLAAGRAQRRPVVSEALQDKGLDGRWALHVYRPLAETDRPWL